MDRPFPRMAGWPGVLEAVTPAVLPPVLFKNPLLRSRFLGALHYLSALNL